MIASIFIRLICLYRLVLSPWLGNQCRFTPTCSVYAEEAFRVHGALRGGILALRRLGRCHPWDRGPWIDPVPLPGGERVGSHPGFGYNRGAGTAPASHPSEKEKQT